LRTVSSLVTPGSGTNAAGTVADRECGTAGWNVKPSPAAPERDGDARVIAERVEQPVCFISGQRHAGPQPSVADLQPPAKPQPLVAGRQQRVVGAGDVEHHAVDRDFGIPERQSEVAQLQVARHATVRSTPGHVAAHVHCGQTEDVTVVLQQCRVEATEHTVDHGRRPRANSTKSSLPAHMPACAFQGSSSATVPMMSVKVVSAAPSVGELSSTTGAVASLGSMTCSVRRAVRLLPARRSPLQHVEHARRQRRHGGRPLRSTPR
jgi:hypothetical protein